MKRPANVVAVDKLDWFERKHGERFGFRRKQMGAAAGGRQIGCSFYEVPPGKKSFPYHYHTANEEAIFVLEGAGTVRLDGADVPIGKGDYIAFPVGPVGAHQVIDTSGEPLRYLCISTMTHPEVSVYPDSAKVGVFTGSAPGGSMQERAIELFLKTATAVDYWEGE